MVPRKSDVPSGISHSITNTNESMSCYGGFYVINDVYCVFQFIVSEKSKVTTGMFPSITNTNEGKCIVCEGDSLCTQSNF